MGMQYQIGRSSVRIAGSLHFVPAETPQLPDERSWGSEVPPAVLFRYTPDRKGIHPRTHLSQFTGALHADGYAGFDRLFETGRIHEIACWAHARRKFFDLFEATQSPIGKEAWTVSVPCMALRTKSAADHRMNARQFDKHVPDRCSMTCAPG